VDAAADAEAGVGDLAADQLNAQQDLAGPVVVGAAVVDRDRADDPGPGGRVDPGDAVGAAAIPGLVPVRHDQQRGSRVLADALDGLEHGPQVVQIRSAGPGYSEIQRIQHDQSRRAGGEVGLDGRQFGAGAGGG
jgi:hypothetical protein